MPVISQEAELEDLEMVEVAEAGLAEKYEVVGFAEPLGVGWQVEKAGAEHVAESAECYLTSGWDAMLLETGMTPILDQYRNYMEPSVGEKIAEKGKLVGQRGRFHQYCEAYIHMACLF